MTHDSTCWTMIRGAMDGDNAARNDFAERYQPVVRAYLGARWRRDRLIAELEDACQEVFLDMFKQGGALTRVDEGRPGGFRAYLYGIVRFVALRCETRRARSKERPASDDNLADNLPADGPALESIFDRAWSTSLLDQAIKLHGEQAEQIGERGLREVELLRMRFWEDLPIREIARRWGEDPAKVHKQYARARESFKCALAEVVAFHNPGAVGAIERECRRLLTTLP